MDLRFISLLALLSEEDGRVLPEFCAPSTVPAAIFPLFSTLLGTFSRLRDSSCDFLCLRSRLVCGSFLFNGFLFLFLIFNCSLSFCFFCASERVSLVSCLLLCELDWSWVLEGVLYFSGNTLSSAGIEKVPGSWVCGLLQAPVSL